ncbi:MAG TPA: hypothetical protein VEY06_06455 [Flavisolibacter sp.]|nr:hypothetical protein [Flavisolibacter sp.]
MNEQPASIAHPPIGRKTTAKSLKKLKENGFSSALPIAGRTLLIYSQIDEWPHQQSPSLLSRMPGALSGF